jgi:hypothetical protein
LCCAKKNGEGFFYSADLSYENRNEELTAPGIFCSDTFKMLDAILLAKSNESDCNFIAKISIDTGMTSLKICVQILNEENQIQDPVLIVALADVPETQKIIEQMFDEIDLFADLEALKTIYNIRVVFCQGLKCKNNIIVYPNSTKTLSKSRAYPLA